MNKPFIATLIVLMIAPAWARQPVATGYGGAVATISDPASQAAMRILNAGGNAIDAAVAAAATLGVTDPFSCGIGGGGFMLIYSAKDKKIISIDSRETAPAYFNPQVYQKNGKEMEWDDVVPTGISVGVPGTVRGWHEALARYGSMDMARVLQPAIQVADSGFKISPNFYRINQINEAKFARFSSTSALYLKDGKALPVGTSFRNPDLAATYRAISKGGVKAFYEGPLAKQIVQAVNMPPVNSGVSVMTGQMTLADLKDYEARLRQPVHSTYRGLDLYGMAMPSSGGIAIAEALNILEGFDLKTMPKAQVEHLYMEAAKLAFADRNAYVADGEYTDVPKTGLLSKAYAAERAKLIDLKQSHGKASAGDPFLFQDDQSRPLRPKASLSTEPAHTTHLTVSDKEGNIVAYTFTIEDWGGSGIVVPGKGFLLNNEMTDFEFSGPHPNIPEAGKRPRSSMSPTLAFKNGKPVFSIGSPGGSTIITTVLQTIVNHIDLGMPLGDALAAPRLSQRNGDKTEVETLLQFTGSPQAKALEQYGHQWSETDEIGAANGLQFNADGSTTAVSEPLRHGGGSAMVQKPQ
ncbi:gamma-glutamyltransferase [Iodobacter fluviatilis]|uniref:Glutathione hydrolase proenzyme n=1 Tax=Iodobacter fluviatilis TaxID=537 RepID=A0A377Q7L9_9NEIS|nr:gamma-glutamyltransferase [Iodobacter fluviatilis]TCU89457.1 gamma-glutamyltranspeptidase/glutathione hydrolase [Iodobacter fluviatilis]STQ90827.1 Gamma-glutamyltranspeptidase precursor [Iodobacter fluviatilis]